MLFVISLFTGTVAIGSETDGEIDGSLACGREAEAEAEEEAEEEAEAVIEEHIEVAEASLCLSSGLADMRAARESEDRPSRC
jgi:hypothetical protein